MKNSTTSFDTVAEGINRKGRFTGALTITHNATSLILPGAANITTAANDRYEARSLGSGNWIVTKYQKADGTGTGTLGNAVGNTGEAETHTLSTAEMPGHTHSESVGHASTTNTNNGNHGGANTGYETPSTVGSSTGSTGGGGAHNNMQPSAVVLKIIKT